MKKIILKLLIVTFLVSCTKDDVSKEIVFILPQETQSGANTFGVTINGKVYLPKDPEIFDSYSVVNKGVVLWGFPDEISYLELEVKCSNGFKINIHMQDIQTIGQGHYILNQSNFQERLDSYPNSNIFFRVYRDDIQDYAYYSSLQDQSELNITRYDFTNRIISGNFSGKFLRYGTTDDIITITDGRFDIDWDTILNTPFP